MSARTPQSYKLQEQTKRSVQLEIKDATYNQGTHKAFICKVDLESIWRNSTKIRTIFGSSPAWTDNELNNIQNNFVKIISILVSINSAQVNQFRELFYAFRGGGRDRTDKDLPFTEDETHFLGADQELFLEKQYAFLPVTIEQSDESQTQEVEQQYRLPFLEEGLALGCGGFGTVFKVKVAPRYLRTKVDDETHFNEEARPLACKRFQTDHSGEDFKREVKNLGLLKESLATRKHIMLHITTIVHGGDFNILLPIAKHGNLEVFLNRGLDKNDGSAKAQTLYNFETVFPRFEDPLRHKSILSEMYALADALLWLHRDLNIPTDPDLCCAHMDLKPNNILIDSGGPSRIFGKWMITDFGISVFRRVPLTEEDDEKEDVTNVGVETVGDLGARLEPRTATIKTKQLHEGTYQAPEAYRLGVKRVGRKSDIWSFGCVLSEVLAFALGDEELLKEFRNLRVEGFKNDYFYRERKVTIDEEDNRFLGTSNPGSAYVYEPKFDIDCWLSNLPRRYPKHSHWLKSCVDLIKSTLEIDPKFRVDAALLTKNLKKVLTLLDKEFRSPPSLGQISPVRRPPAVPQHTNGLGIQGLQNSPNPPRPRIPTLMAYPPSSVFVSESLASTSFPSVVGPPDLTTVIARTDRNHRRLSLREDPDQSGVSTTQVGYTTPPPSRPRLAELQSSNPSPDRQSSESGTAYHRNQPQSPISSRSSITTQTSSGSRSVKCNLSGGKVTSHSLSPDGVYAAFLYASHVCICRVNTGEQLKTVSLTSDDKWLTIRISGFYLAVSGFTKAKKKTFLLRDWKKPDNLVELPSEIKPNGISNVTVSRKGLYGFVSARNIILFDIHTKSTHELRVGLDNKIKEAAFGSNGSWLCAWALGADQHCPSRSYFWGVENWPQDPSERQVGIQSLKGEHDTKDQSVPKILLLPFQSLPSSVICKDNNLYFIAHETKNSVSIKSNTIKSTTINDALLSCVLHDDTLICVFKPKVLFSRNKLELRNYRLGESSALPRSIDTGHIVFSKFQGDIDSSTQIAALPHEPTVILCNLKGEVEIVYKNP